MTNVPLVVMGDISKLRVRAEVDERDVAKIKMGQETVIRCDAYPGKNFNGRVVQIAPSLGLPTMDSRHAPQPANVGVMSVLIDLDGKVPLLSGMRTDVLFRPYAKPIEATPPMTLRLCQSFERLTGPTFFASVGQSSLSPPYDSVASSTPLRARRARNFVVGGKIIRSAPNADIMANALNQPNRRSDGRRSQERTPLAHFGRGLSPGLHSGRATLQRPPKKHKPSAMPAPSVPS
jgi:hypothetical protein